MSTPSPLSSSPARNQPSATCIGSNVENFVSTTGMPAIRQRAHDDAIGKENRQPGILAGVQPQGDGQQGKNCAPRLLQAARTGDLAQLQPLLSIPQFSIADCNAALTAAARQGHGDSVLMLLGQTGIDANARDSRGNTALIWAVRNGHMHVAGILLKQAAVKPLLANYAGMDALAAAAQLGHPGMMRVALGKPDIAAHARSGGCFAALAAAASAGHEAVLQELLSSSGIGINQRDHNGLTLLMMAAEKGQYSVLEWLLEFPSVDVNLKERHGMTALMLAAAAGHAKCIERLLAEPGIDIQTGNALGETALICAVMNKHSSAAQSLLDDSYRWVKACDQKGDSALIAAASRGNHALVARMFRSCPPYLESRLLGTANNDGDTALIRAVQNGHLRTVKVLMATRKADPTEKNRKGMSPISIAVAKRQIQILRALLVSSRVVEESDMTRHCMEIMRKAIARQDREVLIEFLSSPTLHENLRKTWAYQLMADAASAGDPAVIDVLLAPPLLDYYARKGPRGSALLNAAGYGQAALVRKLLNISIDVNTADAAGCTTLMHAAMEGQLDVMEALLQAPGIHVDRLDNAGHSALSHAARNGHEACAALLISSRRVNPNRQIKKVPLLEWAVTKGNTWFVQMLLDAGAYFDPVQKVHAEYLQANPSLEKDVATLLDAYQQRRRKDGKSWYAVLHDTLHPSAPVLASTDPAASTTAATQNPAPTLQELALRKTCAAIISGMCADSTVANLLLYAPQMPDWQIPALIKAAALASIAGHYHDPDKQKQLDTEIASALTPAMRQVFPEAMARFRKAKRNIDRYAKNGRTPLTQAAAVGDIDMIDLLLALGANIDLPDSDGDHALHAAASAKQWHAYVHLVERQANPASFRLPRKASWQYALTACQDGPENGREAADALLSVSAIDANLVGTCGSTVLLDAALQDNRWLFEQICALPGVDVNFTNAHGTTALLHTATIGNTDAVRLLLQLPGIDVDKSRNSIAAISNHGDTPLIMAAYRGHIDVVNLLLKMPGIKVNHQNTSPRINPHDRGKTQKFPNNTALMYAAEYGRSNVVTALLAHPGIDASVRDDNGDDAAALARAAGHHDIVKRLAAFAARQ